MKKIETEGLFELNMDWASRFSLKNLSHYIYALTLFLLLLSLSRVYFYYKYFSINILEFLNLGELLSQILPLIFNLSFIFIIIIIVLLAANHIEKKAVIGTGLILFIVKIIGFFIPSFDHFQLVNFDFILYYSISALLSCLLSIFINWSTDNLVSMRTFGISVLLYFILYTTVLSYSTASKFHNKKLMHTTEVIFKNGFKIKGSCTSNVFVIGMTEDYLLCYNDSINKPQIYRRDEIELFSPGPLPLSSNFSVEEIKNDIKYHVPNVNTEKSKTHPDHIPIPHQPSIQE